MLKLDRSAPFVSQVFSFMQGEASVESCIQILRQHEQKWNVEHIAPQLDVYVEGDEIRVKSPKQHSHIIGLKDENGLWEEYVLKRYYGFLSETHLVLETMQYSDNYDIILSDTYSFQATARAWGGMYADWANKNNWFGRHAWTYVDFYISLVDQIEDFDKWSEAVYNIILLKTRQEVDGPNSRE